MTLSDLYKLPDLDKCADSDAVSVYIYPASGQRDVQLVQSVSEARWTLTVGQTVQSHLYSRILTPFPSLAGRYTWMVATLLSLILPPLSVYSGILQLRAIRERAYSLPLSLWPSTLKEAKQFLATFASTYQGNMFSNLAENRIKAANSQGGPSSAYHGLFEVVPDDSFPSRLS